MGPKDVFLYQPSHPQLVRNFTCQVEKSCTDCCEHVECCLFFMEAILGICCHHIEHKGGKVGLFLQKLLFNNLVSKWRIKKLVHLFEIILSLVCGSNLLPCIVFFMFFNMQWWVLAILVFPLCFLWFKYFVIKSPIHRSRVSVDQ